MIKFVHIHADKWHPTLKQCSAFQTLQIVLHQLNNRMCYEIYFEHIFHN